MNFLREQRLCDELDDRSEDTRARTLGVGRGVSEHCLQMVHTLPIL